MDTKNLIIIRDLLWKMDTLPELPSPSFDPFKGDEGLFEAILLDIYYVPLLKKVLFLFDYRSSLSADEGNNTGVLICENVSSINFSETEARGIWNIGTSTIVTNEQGILEIKLNDLLNPRSINIKAKRATLLYGFVDGISDVAAIIEMDNLKPFLDTIPTLTSQITINSKSSLLVED